MQKAELVVSYQKNEDHINHKKEWNYLDSPSLITRELLHFTKYFNGNEDLQKSIKVQVSKNAAIDCLAMNIVRFEANMKVNIIKSIPFYLDEDNIVDITYEALIFKELYKRARANKRFYVFLMGYNSKFHGSLGTWINDSKTTCMYKVKNDPLGVMEIV